MRALVVAPVSPAAIDADWLRSANFVVEATETGEDALDLARHYDFDIVILDLQLPDMDGYAMLRRMRNSGLDVPVLALSAMSQPEATVRALQLGADDHLIKPFDRAELLARVKAIIRRSKGFSAPVLQVGPLQLDLNAREVIVHGQRPPLTGREYAMLELLVLRKGITVTKDAFLTHLYGGLDEPDRKIIDVFICKIRRKLAELGGHNLIGTVWGRGYILRDNVDAVEPESTTVADLGELLPAY